ncbi:MAG: LD-carboxypeptidase [Holosporaceae bacterium]|jgi:muramoyltetrapeptide carboxypeptidase|nr:LD-carboxypeptidase [Holosporaceae bacterium]
MKKFTTLLLLCLCVGCAENHRKPEKLPEAAEKSPIIPKICDRIRRLDMIAVTPGSGTGPQTASYLKKCGINAPDTSLANKDVFNSADTDDHRLNYFLDAINSDHKIIWAVRGGFGTERLVASLNRLPKSSRAKTLVGFCDITSLNLFISQNWPEWRVIHGAVLIYLNGKLLDPKFNLLTDILENKIKSYTVDNLSPLNDKARSTESVAGKLTGGNLTLLENSLKTCREIQTKGKIIFIEDVHEEPERIYRMMYHLKEAGKLSEAKAVVFGHFHAVSDPKRLLLFLKGFARTLDIPVYLTDRFGHGDYNTPLIYNAPAEIRAGKMTVTVPPPPAPGK